MTTMPNFLVIGANKAGTTSLHNYLNQHPEIYMSPVKEPMFFSLEGKRIDRSKPFLKNAINNLEDYQALFKEVSKQKAIGESSTSYLSAGQAPERIKKYIPNVKLIAIIRHPAERAYSNYIMHLGLGMETIPDFGKAIKKAKQIGSDNYLKVWRYTRLGFYYEQLKRYFEIFDRNQIKIYLYEDWNNNPDKVIKDIFKFLEVDEAFIPDMSVKYHISNTYRKQFLRKSLDKTPNVVKNLIKQVTPPALRSRLVKQVERKNPVKPHLDPEVRKFLIDNYREDILQLQNLINMDLSIWLK